MLSPECKICGFTNKKNTEEGLPLENVEKICEECEKKYLPDKIKNYLKPDAIERMCENMKMLEAIRGRENEDKAEDDDVDEDKDDEDIDDEDIEVADAETNTEPEIYLSFISDIANGKFNSQEEIVAVAKEILAKI